MITHGTAGCHPVSERHSVSLVDCYERLVMAVRSKLGR